MMSNVTGSISENDPETEQDDGNPLQLLGVLDGTEQDEPGDDDGDDDEDEPDAEAADGWED